MDQRHPLTRVRSKRVDPYLNYNENYPDGSMHFSYHARKIYGVFPENYGIDRPDAVNIYMQLLDDKSMHKLKQLDLY